MQAAPAPDAGGGGTACTPIRTVNEPAENLPLSPKPDGDARAVTAHIAALINIIGKANFNAWFGDAKFGEKVIAFSKLSKANWVRGHFSSEIERVFGEGVSVILADELRRGSSGMCMPGITVAGVHASPSIQASAGRNA
jgi:hypothetical protein